MDLINIKVSNMYLCASCIKLLKLINISNTKNLKLLKCRLELRRFC